MPSFQSFQAEDSTAAKMRAVMIQTTGPARGRLKAIPPFLKRVNFSQLLNENDSPERAAAFKSRSATNRIAGMTQKLRRILFGEQLFAVDAGGRGRASHQALLADVLAAVLADAIRAVRDAGKRLLHVVVGSLERSLKRQVL